MKSGSLSAIERRSTTALASVFAVRMLGLFMVLPVLSLYGSDLPGASPALIGLAIGGYGLTQALLQIPFGALSDHLGRKPIIIAGLLIFMAGSLLAANAETIYGVIAGRCLQGAGAIASAIMALLADLTSEQNRTKAMATMGMSIGISFCAAMVIGPLVAQTWGLSALFLVTALMALLAIAIVIFAVPNPQRAKSQRETLTVAHLLGDTLKNPQLLRLDFGIFILHGVLMAIFVALPLALQNEAGLPREQHWWLYLSVLIVSFIAMVPFIIIAEKKRRMKQVFVSAVALLLLSVTSMLWSYTSLWAIVGSVFLFFMAFNLLEACLPSLVSKFSPAGNRGTAMGVYSTSQFLGTAMGGIVGGLVLQQYSYTGLFLFCCVALGLWLLVAITMRQPAHLGTLVVPFDFSNRDAEALMHELGAVAGVSDVVAIPEEGAAYLKVDHQELDRDALARLGVAF